MTRKEKLIEAEVRRNTSAPFNFELRCYAPINKHWRLKKAVRRFEKSIADILKGKVGK